MEESIYNIIPKEFNHPPKGPLYKSQYPPNIPPTGSTFCQGTTSKPKNANLSGEFHRGLNSHTEFGKEKTFGHAKGARKPEQKDFRRKRTGTMGNNDLPKVRNYSYHCLPKKDPVPFMHQKPLMGLGSGKNFVIANAIENMLSTAKKNPEPVDWVKKKDYGSIPEYLYQMKDKLHSEFQMMKKLQQEYEEKKQCLSEAEIKKLRQGLKRKWNEVNQQYQKITHIKLVNTLGMKRRKEGWEKQLAQIQADIKKLNKVYIFVE